MSGSNNTTNANMAFSGKAAPPVNKTSAELEDYFKIDTVQPNLMSNYDQPTYFITWAMMSDITGNKNEIIIAQTGTTIINIQETTFDVYIGPNYRTKNYNSHNITMKLFEPMAANLTQRVLSAAEELAVDNYMQTSWRLNIVLRGYDPATGKAVSGIGGTWDWIVKVTNINSVVNEAGAIHNVTMVAYNEIGFFNNFFSIPGASQPSGKSVREVMDALMKEFNTNIQSEYGYQYITYSIKYTPYSTCKLGDIASKYSVNDPGDHLLEDPQALTNSTRNPEGSQLGKGQDLSSVIEILMANSKTACQMAGAPLPGEKNQTGAASIQNYQSVFHRLESSVTIKDYNIIINDYTKEIEYNIVPYSSPRMISKISEANQVQETDVFKQRLQALQDQGVTIQKQYDYIFTGLNTEVYKFEANMNFNWYVSAAVMLGHLSYASSSVGQIYNPVAQKQNELKRLTTMAGDLNALKTSGATLTPAQEAELAADNKDIAAAQSALKLALEEAGRLRHDQKIQKLSSRDGKPTTYIDDLDTRTLLNTGFVYVPITILQDPGSTFKADNLVSGGANNLVSAYTALLNQLYGQQNEAMLELSLDIRGDPYWFGKTNTGSDTSATNEPEALPISSTSDKKDYALYAWGENVILFKFNIPMGYDETTGNVVLTSENMYAGFYGINRVEHKFKEGVFTQTLHGLRLPGADLSKMAIGANNPPESGSGSITDPGAAL